MDFTVLGDNVNLAARLCAHAKPGQILVSASTHEAIADCPEFAAEALTPILVKGKGEPLPVYQVGPGPTVPERRVRARAARQVAKSPL
jgi:adenylate cyclase